jgi:hypothetical protein
MQMLISVLLQPVQARGGPPGAVAGLIRCRRRPKDQRRDRTAATTPAPARIENANANTQSPSR